jgi:ABC-type transport system involved in cytochrome c biogenesis permease subunit
MQAELHRPLWGWSAKEIFPILAWLVFAFLLTARFSRGVSGRRSAVLAIAGFALGILTILGMPR